MPCIHRYVMKTTPVPIQSMCFVHDYEGSFMSEKGKMIQEYFDELSIELLMP